MYNRCKTILPLFVGFVCVTDALAQQDVLEKWTIKCPEPTTLRNLEMPSPAFSLVNTSNLAWVSWLALKKDNEIEEFLVKKAVGVINYRLIKQPGLGTQAVVIELGNQIIVAFRGTEDVVDAVTDAMIIAKSESEYDFPGKIHTGFLYNFGKVWPKTRAAIYALNGGKKPLWFTGHSMGGALSSLAAYRMLRENQTVLGVYGFGTSLMGDKDYAEAYNNLLKSRTFIFKFGVDIVPRVPPAGSVVAAFSDVVIPSLRFEVAKILNKSQYSHVGNSYNISFDSQIRFEEDPVISDNDYWLALAKSHILLPKLLMSNRALITDHDPTKYYCYFQGLLAK